MKSKVLYWEYDDRSANGIERLYFEPDFEQADKDLYLLKKHSTDKSFMLVNVDVYNDKNYIIQIQKTKSSEILIHFTDELIVDFINELSVRVLTTLDILGITSLKELTIYSMYEFSCIKGVGKKTAKELDEFLRKKGLSFRKDA